MNKVSEGVAELTPAEAKTVTVVKKQDRLLYLAFYLLLNLAEDVSVEHKMQRKGVVPQLIEMLDRCNVELLILAVTFLKRLSIYRENKELMIKVRTLPLHLVPRHECAMWALIRHARGGTPVCRVSC